MGYLVTVRLFTRASAALDRGVVRFMERRMAPTAPRIEARPGHADARAQLLALAGIADRLWARVS